jgi:predicted DsbA family dithiol-disulfide isomerase
LKPALSALPAIEVTIFTDPGCPFGFNAQRQEAQLLWHYGHAVDVTLRMIVLFERSVSFEERGIDPGLVIRTRNALRDQYGMPMADAAPTRVLSTLDACRAYVGARLNEPDRALQLLRALRRRAFSLDEPIDEMATIRGAAADAGIRAEELDAWMTDETVGAALAEDMAAARSPVPEALALPHRLSRRGDGLGYSTASTLFARDGRLIAAPGFHPFGTYEVAMASLAPEVERRPVPETVGELLDWTPYPLATAEVAELRGISPDAARDELREAGASFAPAAGDGYWAAG